MKPTRTRLVVARHTTDQAVELRRRLARRLDGALIACWKRGLLRQIVSVSVELEMRSVPRGGSSWRAVFSPTSSGPRYVTVILLSLDHVLLPRSLCLFLPTHFGSISRSKYLGLSFFRVCEGCRGSGSRGLTLFLEES